MFLLNWYPHLQGSFCMCPANEIRRYNVKSSPIGLAHTQNDPCILFAGVQYQVLGCHNSWFISPPLGILSGEAWQMIVITCVLRNFGVNHLFQTPNNFLGSILNGSIFETLLKNAWQQMKFHCFLWDDLLMAPALIGYVTLVAITGTTTPLPYLTIKSLQLLSRSGTCRFYRRVPDLHLNCSDLTKW